MKRRTLLLGCALGAAAAPQGNNARDQVAERERGFAASMAKRDHAVFTSFLSDEAVFLGNDASRPALRGKRAVSDAWKRFFDGPDAPFSWDPDTVEVLDSGGLALSSGPVKDPKGEVVGRFTSIWRKESSGAWKIIFDRGCAACKCSG